MALFARPVAGGAVCVFDSGFGVGGGAGDCAVAGAAEGPVWVYGGGIGFLLIVVFGCSGLGTGAVLFLADLLSGEMGRIINVADARVTCGIGALKGKLLLADLRDR